MSNIDSIESFNDSQLGTPKEGTIAYVLWEFGNEMQKELRENLRSKDAYVNGLLAESIEFETKVMGTNIKFLLLLEDYYDFVNKGVSGTKNVNVNTPYSYKASSKIPFGYAKSWMNNKGLYATPKSMFTSLKTGKTYRAGSRDSQAYAMAKSWKEKGTKGNKFYDEVVTQERLKKLQRDITKAATKDVTLITSNIAKSIFIKK